MKLSLRTELPHWLVIAAMFIAAAVCWPHAPERMPTHWNLAGEVNGYGGKFTGLLLLPLTSLGVYFLMLLLPLIDPGRRNYQNFATAFNVIRFTITLLFAAMYAVLVVAGLGGKVNVTEIISLLIAAMLVVIGNFLGKVRPNWFVGVRTPWTLSSKMSWNKTHRLAGWLFMVMGLLLAAAGILQAAWMFILMLTVNGLFLVWLVIYSYLVYRRDPDRTSPAGVSPGAE